MIRLETLGNFSTKNKRRKKVGRGPGSGRGKTSCRGIKGMGARSGCKQRYGNEGGGVPLHRRVPTRGFSNARFQRKLDTVNLAQIETMYNDGETVSLETLNAKRYLKGRSHGIKVLGHGKLTKKVSFQVDSLSEGAKQKLEKAGIAI
ncbi:MAG: 50S ribosomal protein L15 [Chlamydiales bacterium]